MWSLLRDSDIFQSFAKIQQILVVVQLGFKLNQCIDLGWKIRFMTFKEETGGLDGASFLAFGHSMGGDRAAFAEEPTGCAAC